MQKKKVMAWWIALIILAAISCSEKDKRSQTSSSIISEIDATGVEVGLKEYPRRIISMTPNNTEILIELGLVEKLVGVSNFYSRPERVEGIARVGGYTNPNVEKIMALEPDIVFAARGNPREVIKRLRQSGVKIFATDVKNLENLFESMLQIGRLTDCEARAGQIIEKMRAEIKRVGRLVQELKDEQKPSILLLLQESPLIAAGPDNMIDELIRRAGGKNSAGGEKSKWPTISTEKLILIDPQIIILSEEKYLNNPQKIAETLSRWKMDSVWRNIAAVSSDRVYFVRTDLISQPSPGNIEGLRRLLEIIHPDLFSKLKQKY